MTTPRPSPYGPADSGTSAQPPQQPTPRPQQYAEPQPLQPTPQQQPQPPLNAAPYYPEQQQPYGYPAPVAPPKPGNGPGLASLIVGIVSLLIAFLPGTTFGSFLPGFIGIVLGVIGLVLPGRPRRLAAWGLGLSAASMVFGIVMGFVYAFGAVFWS